MIRRFERVEGAPAIPIAALSATAIAKCEHFPFDTFVGSRGARKSENERKTPRGIAQRPRTASQDITNFRPEGHFC